MNILIHCISRGECEQRSQ